jgi:ubiquinone/menaquinone biosynthesis C-methylase UbiE
MKEKGITNLLLWFILVVLCFFLRGQETLQGQDKDHLTLPREVRLNQRQPPDVILKTIGIKPGMIIGEVGAGRGRYTVHIANRIGPSGMIYANDIQESYLQYIKKRSANHGLKNIKTILGSVTEPKLPIKALDMVIMVNVVHCLAKPVPLLKNIRKSLKPGGVIVIVEGNLDKLPSAAGEWYSRKKLLGIYKDAGYNLVREETFLSKDNIYFLK